MTIQSFFLRIIRKVPLFTSIASSIIQKKVSNVSKRKKLNRWFNKLDWDGKAVFQNTFSKIFRERKVRIDPGIWVANFCGTEIKMPLGNEQSWLEWDNAISILGHDPDVKMTYEYLLQKDFPVTTFFDVGANYGTHSLLFLSKGVKTISFEPNYTLNQSFETLCRMNHVKGKMENYAVGNSTGMVQLNFPSGATWLGTILPDSAVLEAAGDLQTIEVPVVKLDEYAASENVYPDLIKIDTEGNEIHVLKGAEQLIRNRKPLIIFESNSSRDRELIWDFFSEVRYEIGLLPYRKSKRKNLSTRDSFIERREFNFIAVPAGIEADMS